MPLTFLKPLRRGDSPRDAAARGFIFTPAGRVSIGALENEARGLTASGRPFDQAESAGNAERNAIREASGQLARLQQLTQQGSYVLSPEDRARNAAVGAAGQAALSTFGPLAESGMIDLQQLGSLLTKEIGGEFQTQQELARVKKDATALAQQYKAGRISDSAFAQASDELIGKVGIASPAVDILTGLNQERELANQQRIQDYASKRGYPAEWIRVDPRTNGLVPNSEAVQLDMLGEQMKAEKAKLSTENRKTALQSLEKHMSHLNTQMVATRANGGDTTQLEQYFEDSRKRYFQLMGGPELFGNTEKAVTKGPPDSAGQPAVAEPIQTRLPTGQVVPLSDQKPIRLKSWNNVAPASSVSAEPVVHEVVQTGRGVFKNRITVNGTDAMIPSDVAITIRRHPELAKILIPASAEAVTQQPKSEAQTAAERQREAVNLFQAQLRADLERNTPIGLKEVSVSGSVYRVPSDIAATITKYPETADRVIKQLGVQPE